MKYPRIKELRQDKDWTQAEAAKALGMYKTTYARYESGQRDIPLAVAIHIAEFYGISLDYLVDQAPILKT